MMHRLFTKVLSYYNDDENEVRFCWGNKRKKSTCYYCHEKIETCQIALCIKTKDKYPVYFHANCVSKAIRILLEYLI